MRSGLAILAVLVFGLTAVAVSRAQNPESSNAFLQQQRLIDDKLRGERVEQAPVSSLLDFQWGGWLEYYFFNYDDGIQKSRLVQRPALTLWSHVSIDDGAHEIFARMKLRYTWFNPGDEVDRQEDWFGPNFDRLWYKIDVGKAFHITKPSDPFQLQFTIGRQPVQFGTGYALDLPLDAVTLNAKLYDLRVIGLVAKTPRDTPNIDRSPAVQSHSDRCFTGVQLQYERFQNHTPFIYALWNNDRTQERPKDPFQDYSYDSFYLGFGSRGSIVHNLNYWAEWVFESGHNFGDGGFLHHDYINAYGFDFGLEYLFDLPTRPRIAGEYMFGSGDAGRKYSPTNALGGNRGDREDSSFVGFGWRDTGLATGMQPSNLHIWKAGVSFCPLDRYEFFHNLELGTNWFLYHKNASQGAISDFTAQQYSGYVGCEMDYFLNWRMASDLSWTIRWGAFFPGDAYQDQGTRQFLMTGVTWSF